MNRKMRMPVIAGNWKMNNGPAAAEKLVGEIKPFAETAGCEVVLCVPYVSLQAALAAAAGTGIKIGAQNCHWAPSGAFTGEVSAEMLKELGVPYVIVGHSERRQYFGETDGTVHDRTRAALDAGLKVILCVGELKAQRLSGITAEVVRLQTKLALEGVSAEEVEQRVVIAYEPVWAIGTGLTATPEQANEVNALIRALIAELYSAQTAERTVIQYGGSMNDANAGELLAQPDIDGGLIGGASLSAEKFAAIIKAASA